MFKVNMYINTKKKSDYSVPPYFSCFQTIFYLMYKDNISFCKT